MTSLDCLLSPLIGTRTTSVADITYSTSTPDHVDDSLARQRELEHAYCHDFLCCDQEISNLHELLRHYEEQHVPTEEEEDLSSPVETVEGIGQTINPQDTCLLFDPLPIGGPWVANSGAEPPRECWLMTEAFFQANQQKVNESSEKPYRCEIRGCEKAYKNANGLKYHKAHGHCIEKLETEIERNAKRPYRCAIGLCRKQYKNLNGLKYHIEHTHIAKFWRHPK